MLTSLRFLSSCLEVHKSKSVDHTLHMTTYTFQFIMCMCCILIITQIVFFFTELKSSLPTIPTISYTVGNRDTLTSVAARFDTTPSELTHLNRLNSSFIYPGQQLLVPDKSAKDDASTSSTGTNEGGGGSISGKSSPIERKLSSDAESKQEKGKRRCWKWCNWCDEFEANFSALCFVQLLAFIRFCCANAFLISLSFSHYSNWTRGLATLWNRTLQHLLNVAIYKQLMRLCSPSLKEVCVTIAALFYLFCVVA